MAHRTKPLAITLSVISAFPLLLSAYSSGADPRLTGAPGDTQAACTACHNGTALNGGGGSVKIILPGGASYTPGTTQRIKVQVSDSAQRRWGFELTARPVSNLSDGQAGDLASTDSNTRVMCSNGRSKPCTDSNLVQFITHTQQGTQLGTTGSGTFEFDWTAPATDVGNVTLYAAGNAANGNNADTGDHIYTTNVTLSPAAATTNKPTVKGTGGVVNAASFQPGFSQGAWVTIAGTNLSATTRTWTADELTGGNLPTSLDGVSVTVNGKAAYVEYISPTQINVVAPADDSTGPVEVRVTANGQAGDPVIANIQAFSPAFFSFDGKYVAATHADNSLVGKTGLFASAPSATVPAKTGETVILYGTGFGGTTPAVTAGQVTSQLSPIASPFTLTVGGVAAAVSFAGLIPPYAALYQFNVQVPATLADGDQAVVVQIGGITSTATADCCYITVQK